MGRTYPPFRNPSPDDEIRELIAERDALKADADRYRWLRAEDNDELVIKRGPVANDFVYLLRMQKLDAAIDAAMKDKP